ncbi:MAG: hypothetical protein J1F17_02090 [Oscillospiraceae bacterium]|nr:hypothetical protein [Oscillospiraceae bacterium]
MRNFMFKMAQFMNGRYGHDKLNTALLILWIILELLWLITRFWVFGILVLLLIALIFFRSFSKNIQKRMRENRKYLGIVNSIKKKTTLWQKMWKDRNTHRYIKCPYCKAQLRVKKIRGEHKVHCPKCNEDFKKKIS